MEKSGKIYQGALIVLGIAVTAGIGLFAYKEIFPEYKTYQKTYKEIETIRSGLIGQPPPPFQQGIKQIVIPDSQNGPESIDRCTSCHVCMDVPYFSSSHSDYVWDLPQMQNLRYQTVGGKKVDMAKALKAHPLIGKEARPFEHHPLETYGCTSCHNGNGRSLVAKRAHGPVFDGDYKPASQGPKPLFTEKDPSNDPSFSKMYNDMPDHDLIFQTTPLFSGPLSQSKCASCHLSQSKCASCHLSPSGKSNIDISVAGMMQSYERGKELYISQGCYACHKIAGLSRGNVGMELTHAGRNYPWFIKEMIVWPQIVPSSAMPNFRLDHEELGDLMAFLMGQTGRTEAVSEMEYETAIAEWESGKKMPWEEPIAPTEIDSLQAGMAIFAAEGCAACHKLKGFTSDIGFAPDKDPIALTQWFTSLFPEQILGSEIALKITKHASEIDSNITQVGKGSFLEELEVENPGLIEGFYSNFKFAKRAKNSELNPEERAQYLGRIHKVLMVYIDAYGLGRDIAPHLDYTGLYRDDEWLLGHFHNPSGHTPKSIMPVMPFDDSKFMALQNMLHILAVQNRDRLKEVWKREGFDPKMAFEALCASCHGYNRQGNGVISEWIYPIPKNLRNPVFLTGLSKERAIQSIAHGVEGTPMPPWGETILAGEEPILSKNEIGYLVDWLYKGVPDIASFAAEQEKWSYGAHDFEKEIPARQASYFETRDGGYYLQDKYYTPENVEAGREFFVVNCATCHGKEGEGSGLRAGSMIESKPRMLTNVPWLKSRDDLHLLRSIKYGVAGTSMIAWGDQTTATQRMQLALFIRSLTSKQMLRDRVNEELALIFDANEKTLCRCRSLEYANLNDLKGKYAETCKEREQLAHAEKADPHVLGLLYSHEIRLKNALLPLENIDKLLEAMHRNLKEEKTFLEGMGEGLIASDISKKEFDLFLEYLKAYPLDYTFSDGVLEITSLPEKERECEARFAAFLNAADPAFREKLFTQHEKAQTLRGEQLKMIRCYKEASL